ncbi:hypothetical protein LTR36_005375 [Oleoguttula mirabilis]|uniref:Uncharacterized protein n=1 Tax=Oleoguttula mirabilis TaxID=1507867 RepID=A0AAV9JFB8_9PEZI|nr:hypothetical protein LTR36_005375 [Oleoguttula mirabilis]
MTSVSDKLAIVVSQYQCIRIIAEQCTGDDIINLGLASKRHWTSLHQNLMAMHNKWAYSLRCDGSGVMRWDGVNRRIWQGGPFFQCLDTLFQIPRARPCDGCGVAVCNICRFHVDRSNNYLWGWQQEAPFDDESENRRIYRPAWRDADYKYRRAAAQTDTEKAETILAAQWRVYCQKHMDIKKVELRKMLRPGYLPGPLCRCNPIDRFVIKSWLCMECFEKQFSDLSIWPRSELSCAVSGCYGRAVPGWKQCGWCKLLIEPCAVTGFNAVYRTE